MRVVVVRVVVVRVVVMRVVVVRVVVVRVVVMRVVVVRVVVVAIPFSASSTHESSQSGATPLLQVKMVGNGTRPAAKAASAAALAVAPHTARRVLSWGTCEGPRACTSPRIHACACVHTMHAES
jgi:hypothetical protein|tara:strand:+ start:54 stop:425 length:372 start_codon:yes stop_codon:yes gene_type:complete